MGDKISNKTINDVQAEIRIGELSKGVYIFKIVCESKTFINRIVYQ